MATKDVFISQDEMELKYEGLTSIIIPAGVTSIGYEAIEGCKSLKSIIIPDSVTTIGADAFARCTSLKSITIPNSVINIGNYAFYYCTNFKKCEYLYIKKSHVLSCIAID